MSDRQTLRLDPDDPTKTQVQTRDGREVRILAVIEGQLYPIIGVIKNDKDEWLPESWTANGNYATWGDSNNDLVNAPKQCVVYLNIYPDCRIGSSYPSRKKADDIAVPQRLACVRVEWEEGQFDE